MDLESASISELQDPDDTIGIRHHGDLMQINQTPDALTTRELTVELVTCASAVAGHELARQEEEGEGKREIDHQELRALEPVGASVACHLRRDQH